MSDTQKLTVTYKKAAENKPVLDSLLMKVARQTGARPISNLKNPDTTVKKVQTKNEEDPKRNYKLDDVNDVARGRLVYGSVDAMTKGVDAFKQDVKKTGLKVDKVENFFQHPQDGYKGIHIDVEFPNGQKSEVQFHTLQSYAAALATHASHAQYDDQKPADIAQRDQQLNNSINTLKPQDAAQLAQVVEQQNQPQIQQGQVAALKQAGQQPGAPNV